MILEGTPVALTSALEEGNPEAEIDVLFEHFGGRSLDGLTVEQEEPSRALDGSCKGRISQAEMHSSTTLVL